MSIKAMPTPIAAVILLAILLLPTGCNRLGSKKHVARNHKKDSQIVGYKQRSCTCGIPSSPTHIETPSVVVVSREIDE
jgi:hypothetical protein